MDRLNHVKIVTPDPEAVDHFLREILDVPAGWPLPAFKRGGDTPKYPPVEPRPITWESVMSRRGDDGSGGFITGTPESKQFQILRGARAGIWSVAVGTRHLERAHKRCIEAGIPCSDALLVDWSEDDSVRAFFAEVGGIMFEVMRVEPKR
jgi:catechol 2,3-dioxygenase-like lactoylglutathione lyase family enzyme